MTYSATAAWVRPRLWVGAVAGLVQWVVWLGSLASGGWYKDAEGTLIRGGPPRTLYRCSSHSRWRAGADV